MYEVSFLTQSNALADVLGSVDYLVRSITKLSIANVFQAGGTVLSPKDMLYVLTYLAHLLGLIMYFVV